MSKHSTLFTFSVILISLLTTSCKTNDKAVEEFNKKVQNTYAHYNDTSKDRVIDAYYKRFRINAPKGTEVILDESKDLCYMAKSEDKKSSIYVWASDANSVALQRDLSSDAKYTFKKKYILAHDKEVFNLGRLMYENKKKGSVNRYYEIDENTRAITKTYYNQRFAYIYCAFYPKDDSTYVHEVTESFSPTRVAISYWIIIPILSIMLISLIGIDSESYSHIFIITTFISLIITFIILLYPAFIEYSRGYIPFRSIIYEAISLFI